MENLDKKENNIKKHGKELEKPEQVVESLKREIDKEIDITEKQLITSISNLPLEDSKKDVPNIMGDLREKLVGTTTKKVLTTLAAYGMYFGFGTGNVQAENLSDAEFLNTETVETPISTPETDLDDGKTYNLNMEPGLENQHVMKFKTNFEMGSAEMSAEVINSFSQEISDFLDSFSKEDLEKVKYGEMIVKIPSGSSHHEVVGVQETLGQEYSNNYELSKIRGEAMKSLTLNQLAKRGINNPIIMLDIPNVENLEQGVSENDERFAGIEIMELSYENLAKNYDVLVVDPSGSMENDRNQINQFIGERADIIDLDTRNRLNDTKELLFQTMKRLVDSSEVGTRIAFLTDEGDNTSFSSEEMKKYRDLALEKDMEITGIMINPEDPNDILYFDYLNMMHAVKDTGGNRGDVSAFNLVKRILDLRINRNN